MCCVGWVVLSVLCWVGCVEWVVLGGLCWVGCVGWVVLGGLCTLTIDENPAFCLFRP